MYPAASAAPSSTSPASIVASLLHRRTARTVEYRSYTERRGTGRDQSDDRQRINGSRNSIYRVIISARGVPRPHRSAATVIRFLHRRASRPRTQHANRLVRSHACLFLGLIHASCHSSSENIDPSCLNLVLLAYARRRSLSIALEFAK